MVLGVVFVLVGILGFFNSPVLGIFQVNTLHNVIHLLSGILALYFGSQSESAAKSYAKVFGIIYGLVTILGFVLPDGNVLGLFTVNMADNILHLVLAVVFLYIGYSKSGQA